MIEAQAIPSPMIGMNSRYLLVRCGKISSPAEASSRQAIWTNFAPRLRAKATSENAIRKVTILYQPLIRPVQPTASLKPSECASVVFQTDFAMESVTNCQ